MQGRTLDETAAHQHGLVTRSQALTRLSPKQLEDRIHRGLLRPLQPRVYRFAGVPDSWEQRLLAACLAGGAVASHRSAAWLWRLAVEPPDLLEVTVAGSRRVRLEGVCAHRSNCLRGEFVTRCRAIPSTTVARTLVDLSAVLPPACVERAIDDALRRRMVTVTHLFACFNALATRGRRRVAWLRPLLEGRQPGYDPGDSDLELRIARWLDRAHLPQPARQHRVQAGGRQYRLDLAYPVQRLAIEVDGWDHHRTRSAFEHDRCRGNDLELAGWRIVRFTSRSSEDDVVATVRRALSPRPSVTAAPDRGVQ